MAEWESERGALAKSPQMCVVAGYTERASQFLRELHFIEAPPPPKLSSKEPSRSSFGNCTSLRRDRHPDGGNRRPVAVPSGTALH